MAKDKSFKGHALPSVKEQMRSAAGYAMNKEGQQFNLRIARVDRVVPINRSVQNQTTGEVTNTTVLVMSFDNGDSLASPINVISSVLQRTIPITSINVLIGAKVRYCVSDRIAGQEFYWRASDRSKVIATTTDQFKSVESIVVKNDKALAQLAPAPIATIIVDEKGNRLQVANTVATAAEDNKDTSESANDTASTVKSNRTRNSVKE